MNPLKSKNIIVGICGGIAAYKSCELVRSLIKEGAEVQVVTTRNALQFVTPLSLQALSGKKVLYDQYDIQEEHSIRHIEVADSADIVVIAPATASFIGKIACGIGDSLLSNIILATKAPVIFCPSMNVNMFAHPAVQRNIKTLREFGYTVLEPEEGSLACGWEGKGRLPEISKIVLEIKKNLFPNDLRGTKILITSGPTREFIDSVRYLSNPSTGKMGLALAKAAYLRGASVTVISGPSYESPPESIVNIKIESAQEMYEQVMKHAPEADIVIKAAAVADYTPIGQRNTKIKKIQKDLTILFKRTKDILSELGRNFPEKVIVGFSAESENIIENSLKKLRNKNVDLIVANDISRNDTGFESDTNAVFLLGKDGDVLELPLMSKEEVAHRILDKVIKIAKRKELIT